MKVYTYTQARERLATVLEEAKREEVVIRRRNGDQFSVVLRQPGKSPFDVTPIRTRATTQDVLDAIRESRERG
ncbi:MAG: prevent-host-death protein [Acidobacteria bacterium]|nr:MAG: prevent-host-death protein [Acidobacteriota bacterium]